MSLIGGYGSDYRRAVLFQRLLKRGRAQAFEAAVGGDFEKFGKVERDILFSEGLADDGFVIDVGCGAGRLATQLKDRPRLRYLGVDVVPALLDFAREQAGRPDWRFEIVSRTAIPCEDGAATACAAFSLFTHLPESTCLDYLREMRRVLAPGGVAVFSFLDPAVAAYDRMLKQNWRKWLLRRTLYAPNVGHTVATIGDWAHRTGFRVRRIDSVSALGQSLAVYEA
jgi:ubiquinone/menaquinone biosynthesis C-methylase UbiE